MRSRRHSIDRRLCLYVTTMSVGLSVAALAQNLDRHSQIGMHCATVLHGLARASDQVDFEKAGFKRSDAPEYQGRADYWFSWVAKRVGQPRGQLEQNVKAETAQVGQAVSVIAKGPNSNRAPSLLKQIKQTVLVCAEYQAISGKPGADVFIMQMPQGWAPTSLHGTHDP